MSTPSSSPEWGAGVRARVVAQLMCATDQHHRIRRLLGMPITTSLEALAQKLCVMDFGELCAISRTVQDYVPPATTADKQAPAAAAPMDAKTPLKIPPSSSKLGLPVILLPPWPQQARFISAADLPSSYKELAELRVECSRHASSCSPWDQRVLAGILGCEVGRLPEQIGQADREKLLLLLTHCRALFVKKFPPLPSLSRDDATAPLAARPHVSMRPFSPEQMLRDFKASLQPDVPPPAQTTAVDTSKDDDDDDEDLPPLVDFRPRCDSATCCQKKKVFKSVALPKEEPPRTFPFDMRETKQKAAAADNEPPALVCADCGREAGNDADACLCTTNEMEVIRDPGTGGIVIVLHKK